LLEQLKIENLILIRKAEIRFGPGLNILTGESGAGKSAILAAIRLLCGGKADLEQLRDSGKPAIIEAEVRFATPSLDPDLISESGLYTVRREILPSGKSRSFFNDRLINAVELRRLSRQAIEFADQNGAREILTSVSQRALLDQWVGLNSSELARSYERQLAVAGELARLKIEKEKAKLTSSIVEEQIAEIEEVDWKEDEDRALAEEHARHAKTSESAHAIAALQTELQELGLSLLLRKIAHRIPKEAQEAALLFSQASLKILEAEKLLDQVAQKFEVDPERLNLIEQRIAKLEKLKKKFGKTQPEVEARRLALKADLAAFATLDQRIEALEKEYAHLLEENLKTAARFSEKRRREAPSLALAFCKELHSLHLPHARFEIAIADKPLGPDGCDEVHFLFCANPGQPLLPLEECASGGEQSRIFFAFKSALATKEAHSCLVLDEIDSNVGGIAASILGEKLKALGNSKQIICITHFAQVAQHAMHHLLVEKKTSASDAQTLVRHLREEERQEEYIRMTGGVFKL